MENDEVSKKVSDRKVSVPKVDRSACKWLVERPVLEEGQSLFWLSSNEGKVSCFDEAGADVPLVSPVPQFLFGFKSRLVRDLMAESLAEVKKADLGVVNRQLSWLADEWELLEAIQFANPEAPKGESIWIV